VVGLLTTFNQAFNRSAIHGVRQQLLRLQAQSAGLPLIEIPLPWPCSNNQYEAIMETALTNARQQLAMDCIAFGDLFLEDIRRYREDKMQGTGLDLCFPLWGTPTDELAQEMIEGGLKAKISCVDLRLMPAHFSGHDFNGNFLNTLPATVDPCGENGEFHTFTWAGPMFKKPIAIITGETVTRDGYVYTDLLSAK